MKSSRQSTLSAFATCVAMLCLTSRIWAGDGCPICSSVSSSGKLTGGGILTTYNPPEMQCKGSGSTYACTLVGFNDTVSVTIQYVDPDTGNVVTDTTTASYDPCEDDPETPCS